jgi:hypothetical protein
LLSLADPLAGETGGLRAVLTVGGRSLARHQLGLALALGCTRVVVVAEALISEVVALQQVAEAAGARFHVITSPHALLPLVTDSDDLIALGDGLMMQPATALPLLDQGAGVLALPVEPGLAAGFERIDINHAFAGAMHLPGRVVAGLADLPPEWNTHAALLRLAVQGRVPLRLLPDAVLDDGRWLLIGSEDQAHAAESVWLRLNTAAGHVRSPGEWLAERIVQWIGPALLHAGTRPWVVALGASVALLLGIGAGWFGWRSAGFALLALAWLQAKVAQMIAAVERRALLATDQRAPTGVWFEWVIDGALVAGAAWRSDIPPISGVPPGLNWFAPIVLILLLHLLPRAVPPQRMTWWLHDRLVAGMVLALASALLPFDLCLRLAVVALVVWALIVLPARDTAANPALTKGG